MAHVRNPIFIRDFGKWSGFSLTADTSDRYKTPIIYHVSVPAMPASGLGAGFTTKQLLRVTGISEATLRRWLKDGQPVPELSNCKRDWRGWRIWGQRHVDAIVRYQEQKQRQHESQNGPQRRSSGSAAGQKSQRNRRS